MTDTSVLPTSAISAQNFRSILNALSRPGQAHTLAKAGNAPNPLSGAAALVAVTLCDYQSPIWLSPALDKNDVRKLLRFQTGAPIVPDRASSSFAFMTMHEACESLEGFALGSHEYPDRSTTLVIQCEGFDTGFAVELTGPGLKTSRMCSIAESTSEFWRDVQRNNRRFPLGCDLLLVTADQVLGLPRSTRIILSGDV